MNDSEEDEGETEPTVLPTVTVNDAINAVKQLKIFALTHSTLSDNLMGCTLELSSIFAGISTKLHKQKQCKIYDFFKK